MAVFDDSVSVQMKSGSIPTCGGVFRHGQGPPSQTSLYHSTIKELLTFTLYFVLKVLSTK